VLTKRFDKSRLSHTGDTCHADPDAAPSVRQQRFQQRLCRVPVGLALTFYKGNRLGQRSAITR
jgi:hypothetical protein